jgi:hypothetical protein
MNDKITPLHIPVQFEVAGRPLLVNEAGLLAAVFAPDTVSLRWLRGLREQKIIPHKRLGGKVLYDVEEVRAAIDENCTIRARKQRG